ncbi:MAG: hypothetical protein GY797_34765 [Deltaproteobacteria bacterium]|nr:hypothetical protein [Deltaproteobacteria bacterium]
MADPITIGLVLATAGGIGVNLLANIIKKTISQHEAKEPEIIEIKLQSGKTYKIEVPSDTTDEEFEKQIESIIAEDSG